MFWFSPLRASVALRGGIGGDDLAMCWLCAVVFFEVAQEAALKLQISSRVSENTPRTRKGLTGNQPAGIGGDALSEILFGSLLVF